MNQVHDRSQRRLRNEPTYFSSADYLLGLVKHAVASQTNVELSLPDFGEVSVFPGAGVYFAAVSNMREFCRAHVSGFRATVLGKDEHAARHEARSPRAITELLWQAAFHASDGRLVESHSSGESVHVHDVIKFHHWPNLTRLPMTPNTMRICALLTRQPSSIVLVPRKLGIEPEEVFQIYSAACSSGIVHVIREHLEQAEVDEPDESANPAHEHGLLHSLFAKIIGL